MTLSRLPKLGRRLRLPGSKMWETLASFNEASRILSSNVTAGLAALDRPSVLVTSSKADEGKTIICSKLAVSLAAAGRRVVVVDMDLRKPGAHLVLGGHNHFGVTDFQVGRRTLGDCLQYVGLPEPDGLPARGLFLLATGPSVEEPAELLGVKRTTIMLDRLTAQADVVLLDSPPVLAVADTLVVGKIVGGAILVVDTRKTTVDAVQRSKDLLVRNHTQLLGMVLNSVRDGDPSVADSSDHRYGASTTSPRRSATADDTET